MSTASVRKFPAPPLSPRLPLQPLAPLVTLQVRDYAVGGVYGGLCVAAAAVGGAPVVGAAGLAVLAASWHSWQLLQQRRVFGGFLHLFAGACWFGVSCNLRAQEACARSAGALQSGRCRVLACCRQHEPLHANRAPQASYWW